MGIMANTVSIYQYRVIGEVPPDPESWVGEALRKNAFSGIEATPDEEALGWVTLDDHLDSAFENPNTFHRGDYLFFTLRRDRRRVPGPFLKNMLTQECRRWLEHHPNFKRVPSKRKAEIRENLHVSLLPRVLPVPSTVDLVWNTVLDIVTVATTNNKTLELVEEEFRQSFSGLILSPIHPMERARMVVSEELKTALTRADQAASADVLLQIKKNRWLGWDFLLWLIYQTSLSGGRYTVTRPGPLEQGASFFAYVQEGIKLSHEQENSIRKSHIIGAQEDFVEARKALQSGKNVEEGLIFFELDDRSWSLNLKGHQFALGSYKCPPVRLEKDIADDEALEREAAFFERMALLEGGLQLFDSLFAAFLTERLGGTWEEKLRTIKKWVEA